MERKGQHTPLTHSLIFLAILLHSVNGQECGSGPWMYFEDVNICYRIIHQWSRTWDEARQACQDEEGDLASLSTPEKNAAALEFLRKNDTFDFNVWIGLYYPSSYGHPSVTPIVNRFGWQWVDGSPYSNGHSSWWHNWQQDEPGTEDVRGHILLGEWYAAKENSSYSYSLCQKECGLNQWKYYSKTNLCLNLQTSTSAITWDEANNKCSTLNAYLAIPSTESKHSTVVKMIRQANLSDANVWIGLWHENGSNGQDQQQRQEGWKWVDGSPYDFKAWNIAEPGAEETNARMKQGTWWGIANASYSHFICQKETILPVTLTTASQPVDEDTGLDNKPGVNVKFALLALLSVPVIISVVLIGICLKRKCAARTDETNSKNDHYYAANEPNMNSVQPNDGHVYRTMKHI